MRIRYYISCLLLACCVIAVAQQPQTQVAPISSINAKYVNGVAPGYLVTAGSYLTLNVGPGTSFCSGIINTYTASTLTMAASTTNYVYLNTANSCAPSVKTTAFTYSDVPIAIVITNTANITNISDVRTMFNGAPTGAATVPTINIGAITTGSAPSVYNSGTEYAAILNFILPTSSGNANANLTAQTFTPPISGQYVVVPGTVIVSPYGGLVSASSAPGFMRVVLPCCGGSLEEGATYSWAIPTLPSYVNSANITAIYAVVRGAQNGNYSSSACPNVPLDGYQHNLDITSSGLSYTCNGRFAVNYSTGALLNLQVSFYIYYTGTAPPFSANNTSVNYPLLYDPSANSLSLQPLFDFSTDTGSVNAVMVTYPAITTPYVGMGQEVKFLAASSNTSTTPTINVNGLGPVTITKCGRSPLYLGDYTTTGIADVIFDGTDMELQNPVTGCGGSSYTLPIATSSILGGVKPDGTSCTVNATTGVLSCSGGTGGGVPSVNGITTSVTIAGPGVSTAGSTISIAGGGGSGGSIVSGANVVFTGDSLLVDDSQNTLGAQITATASNCDSSGLCTVAAPITYAAGQWVDFNPSGFSPSCISANRNTSYNSLGYYGTGTELYQVLATGLSSTQFQVQTTCGAATGTGGTIEDSTYFMPILTASQPAFSGVNAVYIRNGVDKTGAYGGITGLVCEQAANFNAMFADLLPETTDKPLYFLEEGGVNDIGTGESESTLKGCFQSFWAQAHTAGAKVIQNLIPVYNSNDHTITADMNTWLIAQGKSNSNASAGQYWDYAGVDMRAMGGFSNPTTPAQVAKISQAWNASIASPGTSGFTLSTCNPASDCTNLNESNTFQTSQYINTHSTTGTGPDVGWYASLGFGGASIGSTPTPGANYNDTGYLEWQVAPYGGVDVYALTGYQMSDGHFADLLPGLRSLCWNPASGGETSLAAPVIGLSLDPSSNYLNVGSCATLGDYSMPLRASGLGGPATAPSGSCSLLGEWVLSQDGVETYCSSSTHNWTTFGGGSSSPLTTKGDLYGYGTTNARIPIGTDTYVLTADSTQVAGVKWAPPVATGSSSVPVCADISGSGIAQSCTTSPSFTPVSGSLIVYTTNTANTGIGLTINVNGLGAKPVAKWQSTTTLAPGDIAANMQVLMSYDGMNWETSTIGNIPTGGSGSNNRTLLAFNPTPVTVSSGRSIYQSTTTVTIPAGGDFSVKAQINRATTGTDVGVWIGPSTTSCLYHVASQSDGNNVFYDVSSGGSASANGASGTKGSNYAGEIEIGLSGVAIDGGTNLMYVLVGPASTPWYADMRSDSSCNIVGTDYVFVDAASYNDIKGVVFSYPAAY